MIGKNSGKTQAMVDALVAERCAPLVGALEEYVANCLHSYGPGRRCVLCRWAQNALADYHAAQGAGRGKE